jgi:hypothetical protein
MAKQIVVCVAAALSMCVHAAGQASGTATGQSDHPSNGVVQMSITPVFPLIGGRPGDPGGPPVEGIWQGVLEVTITNVSALKVRCVRRAWWWDEYSVQLLDSGADPAPLTPLGSERMPNAGGPQTVPGSGSLADLEPSQKFTDKLNLALIYRIKPGQTYTVRIRRSRDLPPVDAVGRPLPELSATIVIKGGPGGADK